MPSIYFSLHNTDYLYYRITFDETIDEINKERNDKQVYTKRYSEPEPNTRKTTLFQTIASVLIIIAILVSTI